MKIVALVADDRQDISSIQKLSISECVILRDPRVMFLVAAFLVSANRLLTHVMKIARCAEALQFKFTSGIFYIGHNFGHFVHSRIFL